MEWQGKKLQDLFSDALKEDRLMREWPFIHWHNRCDENLSAEWVNGTIDVILKTSAGGYQIFDYKTGHQTPSHYATQMTLYKSALQTAVENEYPVAEPLLLYVETNPE